MRLAAPSLHYITGCVVIYPNTYLLRNSPILCMRSGCTSEHRCNICIDKQYKDTLREKVKCQNAHEHYTDLAMLDDKFKDVLFL